MQMPLPSAKALAHKAQLLKGLAKILPKDGLITSEAELIAYDCDALSAYRCVPMCVVLPRTTQEVSAILQLCHRLDIPVVPRGSGTSLAGGALPTADCVVLGIARMNRVLEIDYDDRIIRVEAGRTNLAVTGAVEQNNFFYAPDPSSQLACAIAGNIGMNSGGAHCLKYGVTTNNLLGVKIVLMDGSILDIGGAHMDASGLDLLSVICGSEGQLGVVVEATLRILPKPEGALPILIGFHSDAVAGACVADIIRAGVLPVAIEFMDRPAIVACDTYAKAGYPDAEALLIVEVEGSPQEIDDQLTRIIAVAERHSPLEIRKARDAAESARIWLGRKSAFGAMGSLGDYICLDGTIPVSALPETLTRMQELARKWGLKVANVFHAGDGNMHPMILYHAHKDGDLAKAEALGAEILTLCVEMGGCLSGEHGVGVEKRDLMGVQFTPHDIEAQLKVKDVFDPKWLLNAAKVFPLAASATRREAASQ